MPAARRKEKEKKKTKSKICLDGFLISRLKLGRISHPSLEVRLSVVIGRSCSGGVDRIEQPTVFQKVGRMIAFKLPTSNNPTPTSHCA
jgi:hypothetical protein